MEFDPVRLEDFPEPPAQTVRRQLEADEWIAAILRLDLDEQLSFTDRLVVLTDRRLLIVGADRAENSGKNGFVVNSFPLREIVALTIHDPCGRVENLEVLGRERRLAIAHFTLGQAGSARDFVAAFDELQQGTYKRGSVVSPIRQPPVPGLKGNQLWHMVRSSGCSVRPPARRNHRPGIRSDTGDWPDGLVA